MHKYCLSFLLVALTHYTYGETREIPKSNTGAAFTFMFYNVENLFDYFDDTTKNDNDFLPQASKGWTKARYATKINAIAKVILSAGAEPPHFIGFAEVENRKVLNDLVEKTGLQKFGYKIIHFDSPDPRGIDVAAIYRPEYYKPIKSKPVKIEAHKIAPAKNIKLTTRDILYTKGIAAQTDTLHIFINHWPSRIGGEKKSAEKRKLVAARLRMLTDSVLTSTPKAKIIISGDFNDEPDNASITEVLKALPPAQNNCRQGSLVNLSYNWLANAGFEGTYNYRNRWDIFDQIIVSCQLLTLSQNGLYTLAKHAYIFNPSFLLTDKNTPFKTFNGAKYTGGYSDHLPVIIQFYYNSK